MRLKREFVHHVVSMRVLLRYFFILLLLLLVLIFLLFIHTFIYLVIHYRIKFYSSFLFACLVELSSLRSKYALKSFDLEFSVNPLNECIHCVCLCMVCICIYIYVSLCIETYMFMCEDCEFSNMKLLRSERIRKVFLSRSSIFLYQHYKTTNI